MNRYRCHWSDNFSRLGSPMRVASKKLALWNLPFVYVDAKNLSAAKTAVDLFNAQWMAESACPAGPRYPERAMNPAHCPTDLLVEHGFYFEVSN